MAGNIHPVASDLPATSLFNLKTMPPLPRWALINIKQPPLLSHGALSRSRQRHVHGYGAEALGGNIVHVPSDLPAAYSRKPKIGGNLALKKSQPQQSNNDNATIEIEAGVGPIGTSKQ